MRALYLADGRLQYRADHEDPRPGADEALVRVSLAGVCATDLELARGYKGGFVGVPGHEFVGVVEEAGEPGWQGRRVTASINIGCQQCGVCLSTGAAHCPQRTVLGILGKDGAFAEYVCVPVRNLLAVGDELVDEKAVFAEPLAAALRIREQVVVRPSARVAVLGPGRLGMLVGKVLSLAGTEVIMLGRRPASLALARAWGLEAALVDDMGDHSLEVVVDTTGNVAGFREALRIVRPLGCVILKSTFAGGGDVDMSKVVVGEVSVIGSRCGPFAPALRLLEQGAVEVDGLVDGVYPLDEGVEALAHAARPGVRKILLRP